MAYKHSIQYVNFYTEGNTAKKVAPVRTAPKVTMPKPKKRKRKVIHVDPVAILGIMVAVCMFVMMFVGLVQLKQEQEQAAIMDNYVSHLQEENRELNEAYNMAFPVEEVERTALALGMKPESQVIHTTIHVPADETPAPSQTVTLLSAITTLLSSLSA